MVLDSRNCVNKRQVLNTEGFISAAFPTMIASALLIYKTGLSWWWIVMVGWHMVQSQRLGHGSHIRCPKHQKQRATEFHSWIKLGKHKYHPWNVFTDLPVVWFFFKSNHHKYFHLWMFWHEKIQLPSSQYQCFGAEISFVHFWTWMDFNCL